MAVYKVPQDVEADDKLLGPFSFKQFIFLMVAIISLAFAYALFRLLPPLVIIPLPVALFFGTLALPLRKDQPMEVYMAAVISFLLKPKKRIWHADGIESLVEVIAARVEEKPLGKGYGQEEVNRRLAYLANLVDTQGWSVRGVSNPNSSMQADLYHEATNVVDVLNDSTTAGRIDSLIAQADTKRREDMMARMQQSAVITTPYPATPPVASQVPDPATTQTAAPTFNPYPAMQQSVIIPASQQPIMPEPTTTPPVASQVPDPQPATTTQQEEANTTPIQPSPAIIDLANNHNDLSVETLQREAHRIQERETKASRVNESEEVVISLH